MRTCIAQEAARLMAEEGIQDFHQAKHKAATRLGATDTHNLPTNLEIEAEIAARQRLFETAAHPQRLSALRRDALEAMQLLHAFEPQLIGSVLRGTAGRHDDIQLLLYADTVEAVGWRLDELGIPSEIGERRLRFGQDSDPEPFPAYHFLAGDQALELIVLPERRRHQPPLSPADGQPMARAGIKQLRALLAADAPTA